MTICGFRLFTVTAHDGRRHGQLDLVEPVALRANLEDLLRDLKGVHRLGDLRYPPADSPEDDADPADDPSANRPCIRVESIVATTERVEVRVRYGREGDFDLAIHQSGEHTSLTDAATTREYTVLLYFPTSGATALMVAETRGRTQVGEMLLRLLSIFSYERHAAGNGYKVGGDKRVASGWVRWSPRLMTDSESLDEVLQNGERPAIKLVRYRANKGGVRGSNTLTITQDGLEQTDIANLKEVVKGWVGRKGPSDAKRRQAAADLQVFLDAKVSVGDDGFTDGEVKFQEDGKTQTITATNVDSLLIYPTGEARLTPDQLAEKAVKRARRLAELAKLPIDFGVDAQQ